MRSALSCSGRGKNKSTELAIGARDAGNEKWNHKRKTIEWVVSFEGTPGFIHTFPIRRDPEKEMWPLISWNTILFPEVGKARCRVVGLNYGPLFRPSKDTGGQDSKGQLHFGQMLYSMPPTNVAIHVCGLFWDL